MRIAQLATHFARGFAARLAGSDAPGSEQFPIAAADLRSMFADCSDFNPARFADESARDHLNASIVCAVLEDDAGREPHCCGIDTAAYWNGLHLLLQAIDSDYSIQEGWGGLEASGNADLIFQVFRWNAQENGLGLARPYYERQLTHLVAANICTQSDADETLAEESDALAEDAHDYQRELDRTPDLTPPDASLSLRNPYPKDDAMSVSLNIGNASFCIKSAQKAAALAALKATRLRADIRSAPTLEDALGMLSWEATNAEAGDIDHLGFGGDRYGDEDSIFEAIAPFVESGSTIEAEAEGDPFRWRFTNGKLFIDSGRIVYDSDEPLEAAPEH